MSTQHYGPGGGTTTAVHGCCVHLARIEESRPMCTVPSTSCLARCTLLSRPSAQHITHASQAPHSELSAHSTKRKCQRKSYVRSVSVAPTRRRTLHARARAPSLSRGHCPPIPPRPAYTNCASGYFAPRHRHRSKLTLVWCGTLRQRSERPPRHRHRIPAAAAAAAASALLKPSRTAHSAVYAARSGSTTFMPAISESTCSRSAFVLALLGSRSHA